jgi:hypothetical protein
MLLKEKCPLCGKRPRVLDDHDWEEAPSYTLKHICGKKPLEYLWASSLTKLEEQWKKRNEVARNSIGRTA